MSNGYHGGDSYDGGESTDISSTVESDVDAAEETSAFASSVENPDDPAPESSVEADAEQDVESLLSELSGDERSAFSEDDSGDVPPPNRKNTSGGLEEDSTEKDDNTEKKPETEQEEDGDETSAFKQEDVPQSGKSQETTPEPTKATVEKTETDYIRPTHWRAGMKDEVWENAKDVHGRVRDPVTGKYMSKEKAWDMGHKPGYEFYKHQESAKERGISRQEFLDEYYNPDHYRPELPGSNRSHKGENVTDDYFGD